MATKEEPAGLSVAFREEDDVTVAAAREEGGVGADWAAVTTEVEEDRADDTAFMLVEELYLAAETAAITEEAEEKGLAEEMAGVVAEDWLVMAG